MRTSFIFPGQGSQHIGMGKDLYDNFKIAKFTFEEVDDALDESLSKMIFYGDIFDLNLTRNTQPALMAVSLAFSRVIEEEIGIKISNFASSVAGHSLGQYSALAAIYSLNISDAARLLRARGDAMQESCPEGVGAMAAILKPDLDKLDVILAESSEHGIIDIANDNSLEQIVISGDVDAIDFAIEECKEFGLKAIKLKVSAAFHSRLMENAAKIMEPLINSTKILPSDVDLIDNYSLKKLTLPDDIRENLIKQISGKVRWRETMEILNDESDKIFEIGAGSVLTNLFNRSYTGEKCKSVSNIDQLKDFIKNFKL